MLGVPKEKIIFLLILFSILVRSGVLLLGLEFLMKNAVILDDTFIGLSVSLNMFLGKGFSFNGIEATTGNPVVWSSLLSIFGFLGKYDLALFSIFLSGVIYSLSSFFVYKISNHLWKNTTLSLIITFLFLFNPFLFLLSVNGLETSLFVFFILSGFYFYITKIRAKTSFKNILLFSLILVLTTLTREEGSLVFLAYLADQFFTKNSKKYRNILLIIISYLILLSPLMIWRYLSFNQLASSNFYFFLKSPAVEQYGFFLRRVGVIILVVYMVNLILGNVLFSLAGFLSKKIKEIELLRPLVFYSLLNILFYSFVITSAKFRYVFPSAILGTFGLGLAFFWIKEKLNSWTSRKISLILFSLSILVFLSLIGVSALSCWSGIGYCGDSEVGAARDDIYFYNVANYIDRTFPSNTIFTAGHIGTLGYFSNRVVIDAGGKVDFGSVNAINEGKLFDYLKTKNVSYVVKVITEDSIPKIDNNDIVYMIPMMEKTSKDLLGYLISKDEKPSGNFVAILKLKDRYLS
jgi:hypothetical protein